ncbi:unnamed protein product [Anisakis simplex]|uniref:Uncharacterized protein n=1 Tax=Anisakis simplex TaxID=6269 RepID=A0A0M3K2L4_ANISI|nr:unnamed protein product [Anisakis simplex]
MASTSDQTNVQLRQEEPIEWIKEEQPANNANIATNLNTATSTTMVKTISNSAQTTSQQNFDASTNPMDIVGSLNQMIEDPSLNDILTNRQFDIVEYERKLAENTKQTINLLTNLCDFCDRLKQQHKTSLIKLQDEQIKRYQVTEQMQKFAEENEKLTKRRDQLENEVALLKSKEAELEKLKKQKAGIEWHNVECVRIGECFLKEPTSSLVLPNGNIFVSDSQLGLFLFTLNSDLIRNVSNVDWRWAQAGTLLPDGHILLSMMVRESSAVPWRRFIMKFDSELNFIAKIEGPKWIEEETILRERLCAASNGNIYFAVAGETFSSLFELSAEGRWTELDQKRGQSFVDVQIVRGCHASGRLQRPSLSDQDNLAYDYEWANVQVLSVIGPVTEVLLIEERRGAMYVLSVRDSSIAIRRAMNPVERPGTVCVDEEKKVFVHDVRDGKIRQISTSGDSFEATDDAALAHKSLYALSANKGFLAAVYREDNLVRLHKYKSVQ